MTDKEHAYILFKEGVPGTEIARIFRKTEQTISKWKKEGGWDKRALEEELNDRLIQDDARELLRYQMDALKKRVELLKRDQVEGEPPKLIGKGDLDGIRDLFNITKTKEIEWAMYVKVVRELSKFIKDENLPLAQQTASLFDDFLNYKRQVQ